MITTTFDYSLGENLFTSYSNCTSRAWCSSYHTSWTRPVSTWGNHQNSTGSRGWHLKNCHVTHRQYVLEHIFYIFFTNGNSYIILRVREMRWHEDVWGQIFISYRVCIVFYQWHNTCLYGTKPPQTAPTSSCHPKSPILRSNWVFFLPIHIHVLWYNIWVTIINRRINTCSVRDGPIIRTDFSILTP